jgi:transaldolase
MKATQLFRNLGQSIWLDNITRDLLTSGTLERYVTELSVTGLTSNPTIFDHAIKNSNAYDAAIREKLGQGKSGESLFFELALEDLTRVTALFWPIYDQTNGVDGWASLEVSPLLAHDAASTLAAAKDLHTRAGQSNLFIKIPGTKEGLPAIEEAIFAGIPINVTLLFSRGRGILAGHRAAHRCRAQPCSQFCRLGIRQSVGLRGDGQSARLAARPARHRHREAYVQGVPRVACLFPVAARFQRRRASPTAPMG